MKHFNSPRTKSLVVAALLSVVAGTTWAVGSAKLKSQATPTPESAERQGAVLLNALKANGYNQWELNASLFALPGLPLDKGLENGFALLSDPVYEGERGVVCAYFVKHDRKIVPGKEQVLTTTGFHIVGLEDGTIRRIPVDQIRLKNGGPGRAVPVYPGMKSYDTRLPLMTSHDGDEIAREVRGPSIVDRPQVKK